ncbi:MAG: methyltransferase domain-containing protein [Chloroflexota bacterium]|nr:methyltransferase domain-containing protein [Chloroflexota bacterium]
MPQLPLTSPAVVDLGCGLRPVAGAIGVDRVPLPPVHVIARLDAPHLPFQSGSLARVYARHVLEHLDDLPRAMTEVHRVLRPGGRCTVEVPYFASVTAYTDPTHRGRFTYGTFEHFAPPDVRGWSPGCHNWFSAAYFAIRRRRLEFGAGHHRIGITILANRFPLLYESLFVYWFPARVLQVELEKVEVERPEPPAGSA